MAKKSVTGSRPLASSSGRPRKPRNKSTKMSVVFDEASRKDFLTGFRRRKNERRRKAMEKMEKKFKEEIKNAK